MRKLWAEFKAITIGGNVLDLALGFIIGTAFATLVQSFVSNIFLQAIAVFIGKQDFQKLVITVRGTPIRYGIFLNNVLQFVLLALALFVIVKFITWIGVERGRSLELKTCPFCLDRVPGGAVTCRACGQTLVTELPSLAEAERLLAQREARKWPTLPPLPRRRRSNPDAPPDSDEMAIPSTEDLD
jgi:large conductance mechanosensitive channel